MGKKIKQLDLDGNYIKEWENVRQIETVLGFHGSNISHCCNSSCEQAYGYKWEHIIEYPDLNEEHFQITERHLFFKSGDCWNIEKQEWLYPSYANGHLMYRLWTNDRYKTVYIHNLLAKYWKDDWFEGCVVHHINLIKDDNRLENLQCMTNSEHTRLHHIKINPIVCIETGEIFLTNSDVIKKFGDTRQGNLCRAIREGCKYRGYHWRRIDQSSYDKTSEKTLKIRREYAKKKRQEYKNKGYTRMCVLQYDGTIKEIWDIKELYEPTKLRKGNAVVYKLKAED